MKSGFDLLKNLACLFLLFAGTGSTVFAKPVRILISIQETSTSLRFKERFQKILDRNGYDENEYEIEENADQFTLHQVLMSPETRAVIWISHGSVPRMTRKMKQQLKKSGGNLNGISGQPELIDFRGDNVAPVFQLYSPHLKFVAVIGCNSASILDYVGSKIAIDDRIVKLIPDHRVIAQTAIKRAILTMNTVDLESPVSSVITDTNTNSLLTLTRSIPSNAIESSVRPLRILIGNTLIGVIPSLRPGEQAKYQLNTQGLNIRTVKAESGQSVMTESDQIEFGALNFILPDGKPMKAFTKPDGSAFGVNTRVFLP